MKTRINKIASRIVKSYTENDIMNIVRLFVGDKRSALIKLQRLEPFDFHLKKEKDYIKYNKMIGDFYYDVHSVVEKHRKLFEDFLK